MTFQPEFFFIGVGAVSSVAPSRGTPFSKFDESTPPMLSQTIGLLPAPMRPMTMTHDYGNLGSILKPNRQWEALSKAYNGDLCVFS